jgi:hypothetical protein
MFRVQLCFDRPGACTGTEENKRNAPIYDDRASAVGGVSVRQVPLTSVMDGVMTRSLLPLALGINRIVPERVWVVTFCKRVVKFDRPFSIVDLGEVTQTLQTRAHMHIASFLPSSGFVRDKARGNCRSEMKVVWAYQRISDRYIESIAGRDCPVRVYTAGLAAVLAVVWHVWRRCCS